VDHVLCALPFEYDWYKARGVKATWVGHPFFDQVAERQIDTQAIADMRGTAGQQVVTLLPGSRNHEIEKNWPVMLEVVRRVQAVVPNVRWVVGSYRERQMLRCQELQTAANLTAPLNYFVNQTPEAIEAGDCCYMVSGSISLELLGRRKPGMVIYRVPTIGRFFAKFLMKCRFITLPNLIADDEVMPEYISNGDPENDIQKMTEMLTSWLQNPQALAERRAVMSDLADKATDTGATRRTADFLLKAIAHPAAGNKSARKVA
jgi:lipid-A-disaccharide synthase